MKPSQFIYLLNAMEEAAQASDPSTHGYGLKRRAVLEYVAKLEAVLPEAVAPNDFERAVAWLRSWENPGSEAEHAANVIERLARQHAELQQMYGAACLRLQALGEKEVKLSSNMNVDSFK